MKGSYGIFKQCAEKTNVLIAFDDTIADMISNKKHNQKVTDLYIRGRKLNTSTVFILQSRFQGAKRYQT